MALVYDLQGALGPATERAAASERLREAERVAALTAERDDAVAALREAVELREAAIDARDLMQLEYDAMRRERGSDAGCA